MGYLQELDQLTEALKRPEYVALVRKWVYPGALASTRGESVKVGKLFGDVMHSGSAGPQTTKLVEHNGFLFVFHGSKFHKKSWFLVLPEGYDVQRDVNIAYSRLLSEAGGWLGTEGNLDALWKKLGRETLFGSEHSNMDVLKGQELQSCLLHEGLDLIVIYHDDFCSVATPSDHARALKNELRAEVNFVICKNSKTVTTFAGHHFISTKQIEPNRVVDYIREASKMKVCDGDNGSNREQALRHVDLFSKLASATTDLIAESPNGVQVEFNGGCLLQRSKECNRIAQEVPCPQCKQQLKSGKRINQANTVTKDNHAWSLMNRNQLLSTLKSKQNRIRRLQRQVRYRDTLEKHEHETVRLRSDHSHLAESILVQALSHDEGSLFKPPKGFEGGVLHCLLKDHISRMKMRDEGKSLCGFRWHPKVLSYLLLLCDSMGESKYKIFNRIFDLPTWRSIRNYRQKDRPYHRLVLGGRSSQDRQSNELRDVSRLHLALHLQENSRSQPCSVPTVQIDTPLAYPL